jgi:phosphoribosylformylglycinamidine synthase
MGQFAGCIQGMAEACRVLDFPVVSGNVSLYNETNGKAIMPTPVIGGVGLIDDIGQMTTLAFKAEHETIIQIGENTGHVGVSLYMNEFTNPGSFPPGVPKHGKPPPVDLAAERRNGDFVRRCIHDALISACHDVSDGGLLVAVAEMALAGNIGAHVEEPPDWTTPGDWLFGEDQARYLVATATPGAVIDAAKKAGVPAAVIGRTGGPALTVAGDTPISLDELRDAHEGWLPRYMAGPR